MTALADPRRLFTERQRTYARFIRLVRYPQGIRGFFLRSPLLRSHLRVLDAGCGTGVVTLALRDALICRGLIPGELHAFDLTPAMLDRFRRSLHDRAIEGVEVVQADVLALDSLPPAWRQYDLIASAAMLEYAPRDRLPDALGALRDRLREDGHAVFFITRRNWLTRLMIGRWWQANVYSAGELRDAFRRAGFSRCLFRRFPPASRYLALWGYVIEAGR